jgi:hypothetical protein
MQENLEVVNEFCRATRMKLNVKKSAAYDIKPSANRSYVINDQRSIGPLPVGHIRPICNHCFVLKWLSAVGPWLC